jgi:trk system potassium uptake protein TrkA
MASMRSDIYGVIGVGYFGSAVARTLAAAGKGVIAIDIDQAKLKDLSPYVSSVYQIESISREALEDAGIGNCATVVIGIGENIESSILATLACIEIGVPRVISKAGSKSHGKILEKLGAEVIFPEFDAGERIAMSLMSKANLDRLPISEEFSIVSLDLNPNFEGRTILDLNWRKKYNINVIAIISGKKTDATILPDTVVPQNARAVLSGSNQDLEKFRNVNAKGMD